MNKMADCQSKYDLSVFQELTASSSSSSSVVTQQKHNMRKIYEKTSRENSHHHMDKSSSSSNIMTLAQVPVAVANSNSIATNIKNTINTPKDYFLPLHVDCSVEYELPKQPKLPSGQRAEPLLMIHPCYFRRMESQRRSPFINNMPYSSSANRSTMFVEVALLSQDSSASGPASSSTSASASSLVKKSSPVRKNQHSSNICTTRQNFSNCASINNSAILNKQQKPQFYNMNHEHQQQQQHQHHLPHQLNIEHHKNQNYLKPSAKFLEHFPKPIRKTPVGMVNKHKQQQQQQQHLNHHNQHHNNHQHHHHQIIDSIQQTKNQSNQQQNHLVQISSPSFSKSAASASSAVIQRDQLAAVATVLRSSINNQTGNDIPSTSNNNNNNNNNLCEAAICSYAPSSMLSKHAIISGGNIGYSSSSSSSKSVSLDNNTNSSSLYGKHHPHPHPHPHHHNQHHHHLHPNHVSTGENTIRYGNGISKCLGGDTSTKLVSPLATVPSNLQSGFDSTVAMSLLQNKYRMSNENATTISQTGIKNNSNNNNNNNNSNIAIEKFRQYIKSHRIHPYLSGASSSSTLSYHTETAALSNASMSSSLASTSSTLPSSSAVTTRSDLRVMPQYSANSNKNSLSSVPTASFQQYMQQISCYDV